MIGDRDLENDSVRIKELGTGEQTDVPLGGLADWLTEQSGEPDLRDYN